MIDELVRRIRDDPTFKYTGLTVRVAIGTLLPGDLEDGNSPGHCTIGHPVPGRLFVKATSAKLLNLTPQRLNPPSERRTRVAADDPDFLPSLSHEKWVRKRMRDESYGTPDFDPSCHSP